MVNNTSDIYILLCINYTQLHLRCEFWKHCFLKMQIGNKQGSELFSKNAISEDPLSILLFLKTFCLLCLVVYILAERPVSARLQDHRPIFFILNYLIVLVM